MRKAYIILILIFSLLVSAAIVTSQTNVIDLRDWTKVTEADSYIEIAKGNVQGYSIINKFGRNPETKTSLSFISISGQYQVPQAAQSLEVVSDSNLDTLLGTGARSIIIIGLDENFDEQIIEVNLNGTSPVIIPSTFFRAYRMYVASSGTYASLASGSHFGEITLQGVGGGDIWLQITVVDGFGIGQTQTSGYTVPKDHTAFLLSKTVTGEATKSVSTFFFKRENAEDITSPYSGVMRLFEENDGLNAPFHLSALAPLNSFPERTDIGVFGKVAVGIGSVTAEYQLLLVENKYL